MFWTHAPASFHTMNVTEFRCPKTTTALFHLVIYSRLFHVATIVHAVVHTVAPCMATCVHTCVMKPAGDLGFPSITVHGCRMQS